MKKIINLLFLIIPFAFLAGCSTVTTNIISEPSGAHIEVDNDYMGKTPCVVKLPQNGFGAISKATVVRALPVIGGQYTQTKFLYIGDAVPNNMFFDMNLGPVSDDININVRNE